MGEPDRALELLNSLMQVENVLDDIVPSTQVAAIKSDLIKEIDVRQKHSLIGASMDQYEKAEDLLEKTASKLRETLEQSGLWDFDLAFNEIEVNVQLAGVKEKVNLYEEELKILRNTD